MLTLIHFGSNQDPKWCETLPETSGRAPCRPHRPPEWLILFYSQLQAGSDQIHPLTQLALQPVERRNAATSSLCDIPHTIMHGLSSAPHARKPRNAPNFSGLSWNLLSRALTRKRRCSHHVKWRTREKQQLLCWSSATQQLF